MTIEFRDGEPVPLIGLGTWPLLGDECARVVAEALQLGYRLVDTAFAYENEDGVGRGVKDSGLAREDVFVTTKFNRHSHSVRGVAEAFEDAARKLGVDYIDLMLIHWPNPDQDRYVEAWDGLIALREQGKVRHIGTSNFTPKYMDRIIAASGVVPELNQLQVNPRYLQREARQYDAARGIVTQSWSPLGQGTGLVEQPVFADLARKYDCTPGQVILAWHISVGLCAIPKSSNPERLLQNLRAQDIVLEVEDIAAIESLNGTEPDVKHPDSFWH